MARLTQDTIILTSAVKLGKYWRELAEKLARLTKQQIEAYEVPHQGKSGAVALEVRLWCKAVYVLAPQMQAMTFLLPCYVWKKRFSILCLCQICHLLTQARQTLTPLPPLPYYMNLTNPLLIAMQFMLVTLLCKAFWLNRSMTSE